MALPSEAGWVTGDHCFLDPSWGPKSRTVLNEAMTSINRHLDIIDSFFASFRTATGAKLSSTCLKILLRGTGAGDVLHFEKGDGTVEGCGTASGYTACTLPGAIVIKLDKFSVHAVANTWFDGGCDTATTTTSSCACAIAHLSALIVHEAMHSCLVGEIPAYLIQNHYLVEFAKSHGFSSTACCGRTGLSLNEANWTEKSVCSAVAFNAKNNSGSHPTLQGCTPFKCSALPG